MLSNFWDGVTLYCMNGHEEPVPMIYKEGNSLFFACPRYMLADENHPDGHRRNEPACPNRLSYYDAEKIISRLSEQVAESLVNDEVCDYTGYQFKFKNIHVRVLHYSEGDIRLGILNKGALF